jgi:UDP-N-acetylglucosamine 2-epimerase
MEKMMNIVLIIGTRPQIIKSAPIISRAKECKNINLSIIHTGQHYDYEMSKVFFNELNLPEPYLNLNVGSGTHIFQITNIMQKVEEYLPELKPDLVLVPGDTNSTLGGALSAVKMHIPVAHIESGARSNDMSMPEEVNRILVDHCSTKLFTVTGMCNRNLQNEGIKSSKIYLVGDTMYENILNHKEDIIKIDISKYGITTKKYLFLTLHREENTSNIERLKSILYAITSFDYKIVFPCHPRTRKVLEDIGLFEFFSERFIILNPLPYYDTLALAWNASIVLTDSGGLQKEAYWLKTPCITLRDNTEWMETMYSGSNQLVGANKEKIESAIHTALNFGFQDCGIDKSLLIPDASKRILDILEGKKK